MYNENYSPYDELQNLRNESISQRHTINTLITYNNKLQDLLVELSEQHQGITHQYSLFHKKLNRLERELASIKATQINTAK